MFQGVHKTLCDHECIRFESSPSCPHYDPSPKEAEHSFVSWLEIVCLLLEKRYNTCLVKLKSNGDSSPVLTPNIAV